MVGNDQVRFCASCGKNVYNLSAMPCAEVEALLSTKEKRCVRIRRPRRLWAAAAALLFGWLGVARADNSVPKDKREKGKAGAQKKEPSHKKPARPPEDFLQGDLLIEG
jgi:hypothetical protein